MEFASKKERLCAISAILVSHPNKLYSLSTFMKMFGAAKSTLSEDIALVKQSLEDAGVGSIDVVLGATGGVRFTPTLTDAKRSEIINELLTKLADPSRILPGGFIYTADIFLSPYYVDKMATILWEYFKKTSPDFIITVETKGIPLATAVARLFEKPVVIARRESRLTEGSVVTLNYLTGAGKRMQTMSLAKRAVKEGQRALIIDDFIAGGGTARAIYNMMQEFSITVVGCGIAITTRSPLKKRIDNYKSIITLDEVDEDNGIIKVSRSTPAV